MIIKSLIPWIKTQPTENHKCFTDRKASTASNEANWFLSYQKSHLLPQIIRKEAELIVESDISLLAQPVSYFCKEINAEISAELLQTYTEPQSQIKLPSSFDIYCETVNTVIHL